MNNDPVPGSADWNSPIVDLIVDFTLLYVWIFGN
jgi:hypothetical protein